MSPGDIFTLPPAEMEPGDPKDERPHVLVSLLSVDDEFATVAYCSTQTWEIGLAAPPHAVIEPNGSAFRATGLSRRTVVYTGRLAVCFVSELTVHIGVVMDELPAIQTALLRAIGFRTGVSRSIGMPASGSYRGAVVRFQPEFTDYCGAEFGLIVTDPGYSRENMFQVFVPLLHVAEFSSEPEGVKVEVHPLLKSPIAPMVAATRMVQSCLQHQAVAGVVGHVDQDTMRRVEDELAIRFFGSVIAAETSSL